LDAEVEAVVFQEIKTAQCQANLAGKKNRDHRDGGEDGCVF
jgi:hypothetical protein